MMSGWWPSPTEWTATKERMSLPRSKISWMPTSHKEWHYTQDIVSLLPPTKLTWNRGIIHGTPQYKFNLHYRQGQRWCKHRIIGNGYRKHRQVWPYAKKVPSRTSAGTLQSVASFRGITSSFAGDKLYSTSATWADDAGVGKGQYLMSAVLCCYLNIPPNKQELISLCHANKGSIICLVKMLRVWCCVYDNHFVLK